MSFDVSRSSLSKHILAFLIHKMFLAHRVVFLESVFSPRSPGFFRWRVVMKTSSEHTAVRAPLLLEDMCAHANTRAHANAPNSSRRPGATAFILAAPSVPVTSWLMLPHLTQAPVAAPGCRHPTWTPSSPLVPSPRLPPTS